jgi:hypothetical protein
MEDFTMKKLFFVLLLAMTVQAKVEAAQAGPQYPKIKKDGLWLGIAEPDWHYVGHGVPESIGRRYLYEDGLRRVAYQPVFEAKTLGDIDATKAEWDKFVTAIERGKIPVNSSYLQFMNRYMHAKNESLNIVQRLEMLEKRVRALGY